MKSEDGREFRAVEDEEGNEVRKGATIRAEKDEEYNEAMQQWEAEKLEILETERQILDAEEEEGLKQKYGEEQSQEWSSMSEAAVPGGATDAATLVQKRPFLATPMFQHMFMHLQPLLSRVFCALGAFPTWVAAAPAATGD